MTNPTIKPRVTSRAEDTRRKIYEAAMEMFREKGFEETTMRDIAAKAGVALGGAYYYFSSKDAIVLAFYREMQETSTPLVGGALTDKKKLKERIRTVLDQRLKLLAPNRKFCAALFRHAPDGADPLSPFSEDSRLIREAAIEQMRVALEGGDVKIPADLRPQLPYLLWLYQMALIMFWLYDRSPDQQRTQHLMEKSLGLLVNLLRISSLPLMKPLRKTALELVEAASG
ncbi:MAG TPA: TetR family transcriptional regulator [Candidatus Sulfotelmatobacter sp.]|jgi:AcrR family transcriptional regulator|nr:TetR family transcriptional regulator [Candidatus Sulfotelmatobacter sp.]